MRRSKTRSLPLSSAFFFLDPPVTLTTINLLPADGRRREERVLTFRKRNAKTPRTFLLHTRLRLCSLPSRRLALRLLNFHRLNLLLCLGNGRWKRIDEELMSFFKNWRPHVSSSSSSPVLLKEGPRGGHNHTQKRNLGRLY